MSTESDLPVEERILRVLSHLGIKKAHFAARGAGDFRGLATNYPETIASLALICPRAIEPSIRGHLASRLLIITGDRGDFAETLKRTMTDLPDVAPIILSNYSSHGYADVAADRADEVGAAMLDFLQRMDQESTPAVLVSVQGEGDVAGVSYRIQGSGPPLVLLPLWYAPSQWEPLIPWLSKRYCTITLGGAELGRVGVLDTRGRAPGYLGVVSSLLGVLQLRPGEEVLDVGCGTGAVDRWLARRTGGANPIIAIDLSPYMLREAGYLARKEGLEGIIKFQEGNAQGLPFPDNSFDVTISSTVMEHVDADLMLAEMVRATRPGGRVGVIVRAEDRPYLVNLPVRAELKAKAEAPGGARPRVDPQGCGDASLYRRFRKVGLAQVKMFPHLAAYDDRPNLENYQGYILPGLSPEELKEWQVAVDQAEGEGTFFIATPFHCAVGTKP